MYRSPAIIFVVLLALLWQTAATARVHAAGMQSTGAHLAHAALHGGIDSHHHHDDGTTHENDSNESAQHTAADHASVSAAIVSSFVQGFSVVEMCVAPCLSAADIPNPHVGLPFRPPRPRA
jgi:hypothetical protein